MSGTAQATPRDRPRQNGARRGPARLTVGEHVGHPAGDAAQAVRRAGMRPALDRSFGYPSAETGLVVEQDPAAGTEVARNAMVTLYVAAPAPGAPADSPAEENAAEEIPGEPAVEEGEADNASETGTLPSDGGAEQSRPRRVNAEQRVARDAAEDLAPAGDVAETPTEANDWAPPEFADPFRHRADGSPLLRRVYPRRPVALALRHAVKQVWRYRFPALAVLLLAAVLTAHTTASRPHRRAEMTREAAPAPAIPQLARTRPHRRRAASVPRTVAPRTGRPRPASARKAARTSVAVAAAPDPAPASAPAATQATPEAAGGPFSP